MIKLNKKWSLDADVNCVTVYESLINKKTGKEYLRARWHYPNFESALKGLVDRDIQSIRKLEYIVDRIAELKQDVKTLACILDNQRNADETSVNKSKV